MFFSNVSYVVDDKYLYDTLGDTDSDVNSTLKTFHKISMDKIILAHLNINSIRNKFDQVSDMIKGYIDVLILSESKLDNSFLDR